MPRWSYVQVSNAPVVTVFGMISKIVIDRDVGVAGHLGALVADLLIGPQRSSVGNASSGRSSYGRKSTALKVWKATTPVIFGCFTMKSARFRASGSLTGYGPAPD